VTDPRLGAPDATSAAADTVGALLDVRRV